METDWIELIIKWIGYSMLWFLLIGMIDDIWRKL